MSLGIFLSHYRSLAGWGLATGYHILTSVYLRCFQDIDFSNNDSFKHKFNNNTNLASLPGLHILYFSTAPPQPAYT